MTWFTNKLNSLKGLMGLAGGILWPNSFYFMLEYTCIIALLWTLSAFVGLNPWWSML